MPVTGARPKAVRLRLKSDLFADVGPPDEEWDVAFSLLSVRVTA